MNKKKLHVTQKCDFCLESGKKYVMGYFLRVIAPCSLWLSPVAARSYKMKVENLESY